VSRRRTLLDLVEEGHGLGTSSGAPGRALLLELLRHLLLPRLTRSLHLEPCALSCEALLPQLLSPLLRLSDALAVGLILLLTRLSGAFELLRIGHRACAVAVSLHLFDAAGWTARLATPTQQQLHVIFRLEAGIRQHAVRLTHEAEGLVGVDGRRLVRVDR